MRDQEPAAAGWDIRPLGGEDAAAVAGLEQEIFGMPWTKETVEASIRHAKGAGKNGSGGKGAGMRCEALGVYAEGSLCGYLFAAAAAGEGELHRIAVAPAARRWHMADALMEEFLLRFSDCGEGGIWLEVRAGNEAAVSLYRKHGFSEAGRRKNYYHNPVEDALIFVYHYFPVSYSAK